LILPDNVISYIDFGMMGYVGRRTREDFADVVYGYVRKDESKIADALLRITRRDVEPDRVALETDIADFVESYLYKSLKELRIGDLFRQLMELIRCHRLRFPPDVFLMIKAIVEVEGLGLTLDPDFDMTKKAAPFIRHLRMDRLSPGRIVGDFLDSGGEFVQLLKIIPGEIRDILGQLKQGK
jgi:ubiquinone biosynthesis protein